MVMKCDRFKPGQAKTESKHKELNVMAAVHEAKIPKATLRVLVKLHTADDVQLWGL